MTVKLHFDDATALACETVYLTHVYKGENPKPVYSVRQNRRAFVAHRAFREALAEESHLRVEVTRTLTAQLVAACTWCGARPAEWDMDCDGLYNTGCCESPQCGGIGGPRAAREAREAREAAALAARIEAAFQAS